MEYGCKPKFEKLSNKTKDRHDNLERVLNCGPNAPARSPSCIVQINRNVERI